MLPNLLDVHEAAEYFGTTSYTMRRLYREGIVPGSKVGGKIFFRESDLEAASRPKPWKAPNRAEAINA